MQKNPSGAAVLSPNPKILGGSIIFAVLFSVILMSHHPSISSGTMDAAIDEIMSEAFASNVVHAGMIAMICLQVFGFAGFSLRIGLHRIPSLAGIVAYTVGAFAFIGAALPSGFLTADLAAKFQGASGAELENFRTALAMYLVLNQTLAHFGVYAWSAAIALWSVFLFQRHGTTRLIGIFGIVVGLGSVVGLLSGLIVLDVPGMTLIVVAQGLWSIAVGSELWRQTV